MSGLFRSEEMEYVQLLMTNEAAPGIMRALGNAGYFHFVDLADENQPTEAHKYNKERAVNAIYWQRKLAYFRELMQESNVPVPAVDIEPVEIKVVDVLAEVKELVEEKMSELNRNLECKKEFMIEIGEQEEYSHVLQICQSESLFQQDRAKAGVRDRSGSYGSFDEDEQEQKELVQPLMADPESGAEGKLNILTGAINIAQQSLFERMVFRMTRGNVITSFKEIDEPLIDVDSSERVKKSVFQLIFYGTPQQQRIEDYGTPLEKRVENVCNFFKAKLYDVPSDPRSVEKKLQEAQTKILETQQTLKSTEVAIRDILEELAESRDSGKVRSPLVDWEYAVRQERMICEAMQKCNTSQGQMVQAQGWIPSANRVNFQEVMKNSVSTKVERPVVHFLPWDHSVKPPTYFITNKFTTVFQTIVNTYGMPRYQEANPGLFTIITFPFLYGVMYGDIGHGTMQLLFVLWFLWNEDYFAKRHRKKQMGELEGMVYGGRYMLLLMAFFALYCGTIYNDCFSMSTNVWGAGYMDPSVNINNDTENKGWNGEVYPWGVDPSWMHASNQLAFMNSLKMKMAVILGVMQMMFGLVLGLTNDLHYRDYPKVFLEFIPRFLFLGGTFGYMCFLIFFKAAQDWQYIGPPTEPGTDHGIVYGSRADIQPPNLVQTMIQFFLAPGSVEDDVLLYEGQAGVQLALVVIAFLAIPVMLLGEPVYHHCCRSHKHGHDDESADEHEREQLNASPSEQLAELRDGKTVQKPKKEEEEHSFGDTMIHSMIHTIEFVLGCVSNTASYLRLWALSLAHSQLAEVFWDKCIIEYGVDTGSPIFAVAGFVAWFGATVAVLVIMDALECFLHALRLHWVEFQNKFYYADGYKFIPFDFRKDPDDD